MDESAWRTFVLVYGPLVHRWCRESGLQDADIQDVSQDVLRSVARSIGDFAHTRRSGSFRAWLRVVTLNKVRDLARSRKGEPSAQGGSDARAALQEVADPASLEGESSTDDQTADRQQELRNAIETILVDYEETTRQAFWRVVVDRQPASEVARELGVSVNVVYLAKSRTLRRLRDEFAGLVDLQVLDPPAAGSSKETIAPDRDLS